MICGIMTTVIIVVDLKIDYTFLLGHNGQYWLMDKPFMATKVYGNNVTVKEMMLETWSLKIIILKSLPLSRCLL